jgi:aminoglycoside 3-N-acetyltransferase I
VEFRVLGPGDVGLLYELLDVFVRAFEDPDTYGAARPDAAYLGALLGSPEFVALVALCDGRVVGGLAAYVLTKFERARAEVYIYDLAVDEPFRRRGAATGLLDAVRAVAVARGAWAVYVQADRADAPAVALYSKFGRAENVLHFDLLPPT